MITPKSKKNSGEKNLQNFMDHLARMIAKAHVLKQHGTESTKGRKTSNSTDLNTSNNHHLNNSEH